MNGHRAVAAAMVALIATGAGCSGNVPRQAPRRPAGPTATARPSACPPARAVRRREPAPWPSRTVLRESTVAAIAAQVVDPAAEAVFLLVSKTNTPVRGPWVLCRISLATGAARRGQTFRAGDLAMASGYLWAYSAGAGGAAGAGRQPVVSQISPVTLARIRSIPLPGVPASFGLPMAVTAGPKGSVWIGYYRTMLRVDTATGRPLARITLPAGLALGNDAVAAHGTALYAAGTPVARDGGMTGLVMLEYDARSGRRLARVSGGLLRDSVAGAALTAVPGGVWASFRTGMMGLTIHLGARGLPMITPPGPRIVRSPASGVFHWPMYATTSYGGGALWVGTETAIVACLDPRTGAIRASEHLPGSQSVYEFQGIDPAAHTIFAFGYGALLRITPPRRCWR